MQNETDFKFRALLFVGASALLHAAVVAVFIKSSPVTNVEPARVVVANDVASEESIVKEEEAAAAQAPAPVEEPTAPTAERDQTSSQSSNELVAASAATEPEVKPAAKPVEKVEPTPTPKPAAKRTVETKAVKPSSREETPVADTPVLKLPEKVSKTQKSAPVVHKVDVVKEKEWIPTNKPTGEAKAASIENLSPVIADGPSVPEEIDADAEAAREAALYQVPDASGSGAGTGSIESTESGVSTAAEEPAP